MEPIRNLYRIGHGPSSSHTIGPMYAAQRFISECGDGARAPSCPSMRDSMMNFSRSFLFYCYF
ncbi:MAG: serine dehydratase beta chain [Bacteroidales bacterium]|nr:serine dehydratase beta chain [Bacteroidales bacterium]